MGTLGWAPASAPPAAGDGLAGEPVDEAAAAADLGEALPTVALPQVAQGLVGGVLGQQQQLVGAITAW